MNLGYGLRDDEGIAHAIEEYHLGMYEEIVKAWQKKQQGQPYEATLNRYFEWRSQMHRFGVAIPGNNADVPMLQRDIDNANDVFDFGEIDEQAIRQYFRNN